MRYAFDVPWTESTNQLWEAATRWHVYPFSVRPSAYLRGVSVNTCIHGHGIGCGCGDCSIAHCDRHDVLKLREPSGRALIACQIQTGPGMTWTDRTYEVIRAADGQWRVDFGEGALEPRRDWAAVLDWLWGMRPRDVELLEVP